MISVIIPPASSPQVAVSKPLERRTPTLDALDLRLLDAIRRRGRYGSHPWDVINEIAATIHSSSRAEARSTRLALWGRLRTLLHAKLVFRLYRRYVTASKLPQIDGRRNRRHRRPSVRRRGSQNSGSTISLPVKPQAKREAHPIQFVPDTPKPPEIVPIPPGKKTKSASAPVEIAAAARRLALLPRRTKRRWTGWIGRTHCYRDQRVILPNGEVGFIYGVLRGKAIVTLDRGKLLGGYFGGGGPMRWTAFPAEKVTLSRNESACILGGLKKGKTERPSARKTAAARLNGCAPPRPGNRARGRPRTKS